MGDITSDLVAYFTFDNTANDTTGNNNGTLVNSPGYVTGHIGEAISLNGTSQYVTCGSHSSTQLGLSHTISAWIYMTGSGSYPGIVTRTTVWNVGQSKYCLFTFAGNRTLSYGRQGAAERVSGHVIPLNTWTFVAVIASASDTIFYMNTSTETLGTVGTPTYSTEPLKIGGWSTTANQGNFPGMIDEVRLYNRALVSGDITDLYNFTGGGGVGKGLRYYYGLS